MAINDIVRFIANNVVVDVGGGGGGGSVSGGGITPPTPPAGVDYDLMTVVQNIISVILGLVGLIAVIMIIIGGITYTTSAGDTSKVTKAKNTILYGIVGLVISILAYAIVNFVLTNFFSA